MKKRRILIMSILSLILVLSVATIFAAYTYVKKITVNNKVGVIDIDSKSFYNYSKYSNDSSASNYLDPSTANYDRLIKMRKDTVAVFDNITFITEPSYSIASGTFQQGVTYYLLVDGEYVAQTVTIGREIPTNQYYTRTLTYLGLNSVVTKYDNTGKDLETTINNSTHKITVSQTIESVTTQLFVISFTLDSVNGVISNASVDNEDDYNCIINAKGSGFVVLDSTITDFEEIDANEAYTCSGTEKKYDQDNTYLSQLGLHFAFTSEVAVYVRIHIQDAWKRTRVYGSGKPNEQYILKDQVNGVSPFTVADSNWHFDAKTNYAYLKTMYVPVQDENGNYPQQEYTFNVNEAYFYADESTGTYTQYIDVQVQFTVDIVQANRAKALWHLDPSVEFNS